MYRVAIQAGHENSTRSKGADKAYLAGFIDGEACIGFVVHKNGKGYKDSAEPRVVIYNCNLDILLYFQSIFGGKLYSRKRVFNWKEEHQLVFINHAAIKLIKEILPYLRLKKSQAELCLAYFDNVQKYKGKRKRSNKTFNYRQKLIARMHKLNERGVSK